MNHIIRLMLIAEAPPRGRGKTKPIGEVLDEFEIEVENHKEGMDLMNDLGEILEDEYGFNISGDEEDAAN